MRGWLRYFALNAQVRTGVSGPVLVLAIIAAAAAVAAVIFLLVAAFVWLADLYDGLTAGVVLGCAFALIALIALVACLMTRRRNMERARLELAARSSNWFDPKLVAVGLQIGQAIGWRRLASLAALAVLGGAAAKEWSAHAKPAAEGAAEDDDESGSDD
jgi:MFS superfamily sulfate permease-like transporter